ncbi:MAG: type II toxin-antitoxin system MqsA family antitoxin [bacterium]
MKECYFCKGMVEDRSVTVDYRWGDRLVVIRNVPAHVCNQCGERYYDAEVSRRMERIVLRDEMPPVSINVPVCEFVVA